MCGFIKPGRTKEELENIQAAYAQALSDFNNLIRAVRQSQGQESPVEGQQTESQPLIFKLPSPQQLEKMRDDVETAIRNNPNSTNVKEIVTRALNATKELVEYQRDPRNPPLGNKNLNKIVEEFDAAHKGVMRLTNTLADVSLSMGGIGIACIGVGLGLSLTGVASHVGVPLFIIGLALCAIDMIIVVARNHGQSGDRWQVGSGMSSVKSAVV